MKTKTRTMTNARWSVVGRGGSTARARDALETRARRRETASGETTRDGKTGRARRVAAPRARAETRARAR